MKRLAHKAWQTLPRQFRRNALAGVAAVLCAKPDRVPPPRSHGVIVAGDVAGHTGLAESARILHEVIAAAGLARGRVPLGLPGVVAMPRQTVPADAALLAVVNAPVLPVGLLRWPRGVLRQRRVLTLWAWELPVVPPEWRHGARFAHEIWAPSDFTAAALEPLAPGRVRVVPHPLAALPAMAVVGDRAQFGLPDGALVVLTVFNLASSLARKNPFGAIAAFRAAFGARGDCIFVMKLSGVDDFAGDLAAIRAAMDHPNMHLMTGMLPEAELRGLIAASDIVLSLHRAEGFGLVPATAMLLGRPVVATAWSGNMVFMDAACAALVPYRLVPVADERGTYDLPGALWAEPDIEAAADWLRRLEDAALRRQLGQAGAAHAKARLGAGPLLAALAANGVA